MSAVDISCGRRPATPTTAARTVVVPALVALALVLGLPAAGAWGAASLVDPARPNPSALFGLGLVDSMAGTVPLDPACTNSYVDSTCAGGTLRAAVPAGSHFVGYAGQLAPGTVATITYWRKSSSDVLLHSDTVTAGPSGGVEHKVTDLVPFAAPGDPLRVRVQFSSTSVRTHATAIEYGLMVTS